MLRNSIAHSERKTAEKEKERSTQTRCDPICLMLLVSKIVVVDIGLVVDDGSTIKVEFKRKETISIIP